MAKKKKKMTRAQAAAARRDQTEESLQRAKAKERSQNITKTAQYAQKEASKQRGFGMLVPIISIIVIVVLSLVFTIGPGMLLGN